MIKVPEQHHSLLAGVFALGAFTLPTLRGQEPKVEATLAQGQERGVAATPAPAYEVSGRCLDLQTGAGLARCTVILTGHMATGYPLNWGVPEFIDPAPIVTGPDGKFTFSLTPPHGWDPGAGYSPRFHLSISHPLHPSWFGYLTFSELVARGGEKCGDILLAPSRRPVIRVLDTNGKPQEGVSVDLRYAPSNETPRSAGILSEQRALRIRSDESGTLPLITGLLAGTWNVSLANRTASGALEPLIIPSGNAKLSPHVITIPAVAETEVIAGKVLDSEGRPCQGAVLGLQTRSQHEPVRMIRTNEHGAFSFRLAADTPKEGDVGLMWVSNDRYDGWPAIEPVTWGSRDLAVTVPAPRTLPFVVTDSAGAAVERYSIHAMPTRRAIGLDPTRAGGAHPSGRGEIHLRLGSWRVAIVAEDRSLCPSDWIDIDSDQLEKGDGVPVVLTKRIIKSISVRDESGMPVADVTVRVFQNSLQAQEARYWTTPGGALVSTQPTTRDVVLYEARTSSSGEVVVAGPERRGSLATLVVERQGKLLLTQPIGAWDDKVLTVTCNK